MGFHLKIYILITKTISKKKIGLLKIVLFCLNCFPENKQTSKVNKTPQFFFFFCCEVLL